MVDVVIFGTGEYYQKYKKELKKEINIIGFLDNNEKKQGTDIDGIRVYAPCYISKLKYDYVFLLSGFYLQMKKQLLDLGVTEDVIKDINELNVLCDAQITECTYQLPQNEKKNILFLSPAFTFSGAQNAMMYAAGVLYNHGYNVIICSSVEGVLQQKIEEKGMQAILIRDLNRSNRIFTQLCEWADVIWANTVWMYSQVCEAIPFQKRVIWWLHESGPIDFITAKYMNQIVEASNVEVYSVSPVVRKKFVKKTNGQKAVKELLYGIPAYEIPEEKKNYLTFAVVGDISPEKAQDIFLKAIDLLDDSYKRNNQFWIVGRGKMKAEWNAIMQKNPCITYKGEVKNADMPKVYQKIDVLISCSREDAMPIVVTEAFMNQKLVIASDAIGTMKYIKSGENAIVIKAGDAEDLKDKIMWTIEHWQICEKMKAEGRKIYEKYFTLRVFNENVLRIMNDTSVIGWQK